jgi:hypothetical protein
MLATQPGHPADTALEMIKLIIAHGGRPGETNPYGMTVLHFLVKELTNHAPYDSVPYPILPALESFYAPSHEVIQYML